MERSYSSWFIVYLSQQGGIGWHTIDSLIQHDLIHISNWTTDLLSRYIKHQERVHILIKAKQQFSYDEIIKMQDDERRNHYESILWDESDYPAILSECVQRPWVIYIKGKKELLHTPKIAIVGTRAPTPYGVAVTKKIANECGVLGFTIVSGLAMGIDTIAHQYSKSTIGKTIAILPCGIKHCYPRQNRKLYEQIATDGLLISEYVDNNVVHKGLFTERNRIIAGLSYITIVVEGERKSGSMITARYTMDMDRELYAIPGSLYNSKSEGPNFLIYKGYARILLNSSQILEDIPWLSDQLSKSLTSNLISSSVDETHVTQSKKGILLDEENIVFKHIQNQPVTIDDLIHLTTFSYSQLNVILVQLSLKNYIRLHHGSLYIAL